MKMKSIFLAALAAMTLASCAKDEPATTAGNGNEKTTFVVALPGAPDTYAVENPQAAGIIAPFYNDVTVWLVDGGGNAAAHVWTAAEIQAKQKRFEQIVEPSKVIVIANKYDTDLTTGVVTEAQLRNALKALVIADQNKVLKNLAAVDANGNIAGNYISVQQVTLMGEQSTFTSVTETPGDGHTVKAAAVELKSLVSRFEVGTVKAGTGLVSLNVEAVYVNYFYEQYGMSSYQNFTETNWPATFTPAWATDNGSADVTSQTGTKAYAYQVFTGDMVPHIIYKVGGEVATGYKLSDGTAGTFSGKYITVKGFKVGSAVLSGSTATPSASVYPMKAHEIYKMGLENGGIEISSDQITDEPEKEKIDLIVSITVAPWTVQNVTPEI